MGQYKERQTRCCSIAVSSLKPESACGMEASSVVHEGRAGAAKELSRRHAINPLRSLRILELRIEFSSALSREIEDIPDRYQLVDAAFFDVARQPWMTGIRVMNRTVIVATEDGYRRILVSFFVFASEVVFEWARAGAQKTQSAPPSRASMASQSR